MTQANLPPTETLPQLFTDLYPHFPQIHLTLTPPPAYFKTHIYPGCRHTRTQRQKYTVTQMQTQTQAELTEVEDDVK